MSEITRIEELEAIYGATRETATVKEITYISPQYRAYIEASPFGVLATASEKDCHARHERAQKSLWSECSYTQRVRKVAKWIDPCNALRCILGFDI